MPHETEIVIRSIKQPVLFGDHADSHDAGHATKCRVWWFAALPVVTFLIGLAF
jgi:hypothetical protein